ncbi:MAG: DUF92 domain-containing protein [Thermomicrobiales bacterium]
MSGAAAGPIDVVAGVAAASLFSWLAYRRGGLTTGGAFAAAAVGTTIVLAGGWAWGTIMIAFFVTSSTLSQWRARQRPEESITARGHRRDAFQVVANGGFATLAAAFAPVSDHPAVFGVFVGTVAAATADTWATEIGGLAASRPRLITTGRPVPPGTSGGVTLAGCWGSLVGAALIGLLAAAAAGAGWVDTSSSVQRILLGGIAGGVAGSLVDSMLGATIQLQFACPQCQETTERQVHQCGTVTLRVRGIIYATNDTVNAAATLTGGIVSVVIVAL